MNNERTVTARKAAVNGRGLSVEIKWSTEPTLPRFVRDMLEGGMPHRGEGLHGWLFRVARVLHPYRTPEKIIAMLQERTRAESVKLGEIEDAVGNSARYAWKGPEGTPADDPGTPRRLTRAEGTGSNPELRAKVLAEHPFSLAGLMESSPERFDPGGPRQTDHVIDILFPGDPLLCVGLNPRSVATRHRSVWPPGYLERLALIVPNPMKSTWGITQGGRESQRCLTNVGPRKFLVVEHDRGSEDEQACVLQHLGGLLKLVLVVHSGGKSLHGWFYAEGEEIGGFMDYACRLGADGSMRSAIQLARMPDGTRENGQRQRVIYFDPVYSRPSGGSAGRGPSPGASGG
jgi:hypothetical protein